MPGPCAVVSGPMPTPPADGIRAARGAGVVENPNDVVNGDWERCWTFFYGPCAPGSTADPCASAAKEIDAGPQLSRTIEPFVVVAARQCSTWGWQASDFAADAARLLEAHQWSTIANELWRGDQAKASGWDGDRFNPYLAASANSDFVNLTGAGARHPVEALAMLEDALDCGTNGVIHASRHMATIWAGFRVITGAGGRLVTALGTPVIADRGYDGSGPDSLGNPAPGANEWAYATGTVTLRIEPGAPRLFPPADEFAQAVDRANNNIAYLAERKASVGWGCCHLAIEVIRNYPA